jgi:nicotinamidase-related amidase
MLERDATVLVLVDYQEQLLPAIDRREEIIAAAIRLTRGAQALGLPIVHTEQYPRGLGRTAPELVELLPGEPIEKLSFGCCGEPAFLEALAAIGRTQVLLAGIEAHVCAYQTAVGLLEAGYEVHVVADTMSSRTPENRAIGLQKMRDAGAAVTSVETALFELLRVAEGPEFKTIISIVK